MLINREKKNEEEEEEEEEEKKEEKQNTSGMSVLFSRRIFRIKKESFNSLKPKILHLQKINS